MWVRYNPPGLGDNGPTTRFTFIDYGGAESYRLNSGTLIGKTFKTVDLTGVYRGGFQAPAKMRITKQSPADLTTSESVVLTGNITDFDGTPGCDIQFKAAGTRREN